MDETPPVSSSFLLPDPSAGPFLLEDAAPLDGSELEPAAKPNPELELDAPAKIVRFKQFSKKCLLAIFFIKILLQIYFRNLFKKYIITFI